MEVKRDILWRVYLAFIGIVVLSLVILGKVFYIQRVQGAYWKSLSDSLHQKFVELDAERGSIFSEDSSMLSTSIPYFNIYIDFGADGLREFARAKGITRQRFKPMVNLTSFTRTDKDLDKVVSLVTLLHGRRYR